MTETELNRASHLIDPQLHIWGWEIPVYLFLGGLTAGVMILTPLVWGKTSRDELSRFARWMPFAAPILLSVGMLALFLDLAYKAHVYRFFLAFRPASPMSWGSWILLAIYPATLLLGLAGLTDSEALSLGKWAPVRALRLGALIERAREFAIHHTRGIRIANIVFGIGLGGYTGLLLGTLGARHIWSSGVLGPLFLVSGISTGAAFMMLFPLGHGEHSLLRRLDVGAVALELALIAAFFLGLMTGGADSHAAASMFFGGRFTALFWSLVVAAGLVVPLAIELIESKKKFTPTRFAPFLLLTGGLSLRWILVVAGQA